MDCVCGLLYLRFCLRRHWIGTAALPTADCDWLASAGVVDGCSLTSLWHRFWPGPFGCVFWNSPLRPATRPFSMARKDCRLYSSLARRALVFIASSAALERRTVKHREIWIEISHFNGTGPLVHSFSFHSTCFLTLFLPFLVISFASLFLLLQRDEQLLCTLFLGLPNFLLTSLSLLLLTFLGAKDKINWSFLISRQYSDKVHCSMKIPLLLISFSHFH